MCNAKATTIAEATSYKAVRFDNESYVEVMTTSNTWTPADPSENFKDAKGNYVEVDSYTTTPKSSIDININLARVILGHDGVTYAYFKPVGATPC